ncbi:MAG: YdeI/OmpD-associated family protein [Nanoarchaeota archaeon]
MHEAICFGWIDTTVKKLDENRYLRRFARRSDKSKWSNNTRRYARMLIKNGRMTPFGLRAYKDGLKRPTHDFGIPKNPEIPDSLKMEIGKNKEIMEKFDKISPSQKKNYYRWILKAKLPETKEKRINLILQEIKER